MGNVANDLQQDGKHVLFAFEEAIGKLKIKYFIIFSSLFEYSTFMVH